VRSAAIEARVNDAAAVIVASEIECHTGCRRSWRGAGLDAARTVEDADHIGDGDLVGRHGQPVAAVPAALGLHDAGAAQLGQIIEACAGRGEGFLTIPMEMVKI
jgi:hypothetical protein